MPMDEIQASRTLNILHVSERKTSRLCDVKIIIEGCSVLNCIIRSPQCWHSPVSNPIITKLVSINHIMTWSRENYSLASDCNSFLNLDAITSFVSESFWLRKLLIKIKNWMSPTSEIFSLLSWFSEWPPQQPLFVCIHCRVQTSNLHQTFHHEEAPASSWIGR